MARTAAANRLVTQKVTSFSGGINLRGDAFNLAPNEFQLALNMEIDPRGGFYTRKGWDKWNTSLITGTPAPTWNPRLGHSQVFAGTEQVMFTNQATYTGGGAGKGTVISSSNGTFAAVSNGTNPLVCSASPHLADFAAWGDKVYIACGANESPAKWTGTGAATLISPVGAASFVDDYTAPTGTRMPAADLCETHFGFLFTAATKEDGVQFPNRVRYSHPNNPENWASLDYIDLLPGGDRITAIISFADHLVVCKTDSMWRIDGYDTDSFAPSAISYKIGAQSRQAVAVAEDRVYVFSYPHGIYEYKADGSLVEVSEQLRPGLDSNNFNSSTAALNNVWLNYAKRRLWVSAPYSTTTIPSDAVTSLILDRTLSESGSWTAFRGADGGTVGPMVETLQSDKTYGACRATASVVAIDEVDDAVDDLTTSDPAGFETYLITGWFTFDEPTRKKSWKRPDFILKTADDEQLIRIETYKDYDEGAPARTKELQVPSGSGGFIWGSFVWGDGSVWGGPAAGARIQRGAGLGLARAVRFRFVGPLSVAWGVDAIVLKVIMKRAK